jgi:predicted ATPase
MLKSIEILDSDIKDRLSTKEAVFDFTLGINLLIGPNGSGKSTLYDLIKSGNIGVKKGHFRVETDGKMSLRAMRMQEQGRAANLNNLTGDAYTVGVLSRFRSHGEINWPLLSSISEFDDYTLVLMDEPEQALDIEHMLMLMDVLKKESSRLQFIIATHSPLLMTIADNIISLGGENYADQIRDQFISILA